MKSFLSNTTNAFFALFCTLLICFSVNGQRDGYYLNKSGDTIQCKILLTFGGTLKVERDGKIEKFRPTDIKGYGVNGLHYVSGKVGIKYTFLELVINGPMILCKVYTATSSRDASGSTEMGAVSNYYAKLKNSTDGYSLIALNWRKRLQKLDEKCTDFTKKLKSITIYEIEEGVHWYNKNCGN